MITQSEKHAAMSYYIDEHADHLRSSGCSDTTIYRRTNVLRRLNEFLPLGLAYAETRQLERFLAQVRRTARPGQDGRATVCTYDGHIRGFFGWLDAIGVCDGDPTLLMKRPKPPRFRPRPATREEVALALASPEPWQTMFSLAYYEGMRAFEIAASRGEHITEQVTFIPNGKGGKRADVPTHPHVWALVKDRSGWLFPQARPWVLERRVDPGHWISQSAIRQFHRLGLTDMSIHRLRHSLATHLIEDGVDAVTVQKIMRHASLATTQIYVETTDERKRAAIALLPVPGFGTPAGV